MNSKNNTTANYTVALEVAKSPHVVFNHIVDLSKWWPEEFEGESIKPDSEFVLRTGDGHYSKNKVVEFVPGKKLVWLTTESLRKADGYDWSDTRFIFELTAEGNNTLLKFTYDGVVPENERDKLIQICNTCINDLFYNFVVNGKTKQDLTIEETASKSYTTSIEVINSPREVFQHITGNVAKWWGGKDYSGRSTLLNDEFIVNHPGAHYSKQKLIEVMPDKKVVWLVTESKLSWLKNQEEWTNTKMIFEISARSYSYILRFTHEGLTPEKESYARCSEGWDMVIKDWLYTLITYGKAHF